MRTATFSLLSLTLVCAACSSSENAAAPGANGGAAGGSGASGASGTAGTSGASGQGGTGLTGGGGTTPTSGASVLQYHKNATRDGVYADAAFTKAAAAKLHRDTTFTSAAISGPTYAQPLYLESGSGGKDLVITATEQNQVTALDSSNGSVVWQKTLAPPVPRSSLPCGNIDPMGITGTPVIDAASKTLFVNVMTLEGGSAKHKVYALSTDDGSTKTGWPVDIAATAKANGTSFEPPVHGERGALLFLNGTVYVPYGGHYGDCGNYHGWVVGISAANPSAPPSAWATRARAGGIWAVGGVASDGQSVYVATGNTFSAATWGDGESVFRLGPNLAATQNATDYFTPSNWAQLDSTDTDLGGSGPILFDVPGATPSELAVALGKDGYAYLLNRKNLGGLGATPVASAHVARSAIINGGVAYTTDQGTYVAFRGAGVGCPGASGGVVALKIGAASPPTISVAWCAAPSGRGSPMVTTTNGKAEAVVWWIASGGDNLLRGFDGDTGALIYGGANDSLSVSPFQTPIAAKGRLFVATDNAVAAFTTN